VYVRTHASKQARNRERERAARLPAPTTIEWGSGLNAAAAVQQQQISPFNDDERER